MDAQTPNADGAGPGPGGPQAGTAHGQTRAHDTPSGANGALESAGASLAAVYVPDAAERELRLAGTAGTVGTAGTAAERFGLAESYPVAGRSPVADAFRASGPLWPGSSELTVHGAPAHLSVLPLGDGPRRLGCLVVVDGAGEGFRPEQRALLELYADQITARLEADGEDSGGRPEASLEGLRVGSFFLMLHTGRIDADACALELVDIAPEYFDNRVETLLAHTVPDDLPALMSVVEPGRTGFRDGRELEFRIRRPSGELRWLRLRGRILTDGAGRPERVLGVVAEASYLRPGRDDVSRVQRLSASLATAVTVRDVSRAVVTSLREPLGADRVALAELVGDRLAVIVLDPAEPAKWPEPWRTDWSTGSGPDSAGVPARLLPTPASALREGRAGLWPAGTVPEPELAGVGPGGLAVLPLPADGRVVGACFVGWDEPHEFRPEERSLLTATAGLVGQALKRAHALDAEHELATMLQRSLLPRSLPELPGGVAVARYLPAMMGLEVGGDWYDVIPLAEGRIALVIGDVQGHSAAAATIMGQMRTAIRAYAAEGHPADIVVSHTNRLLVSMETDLFATCTYVELDMEEGDAWIVRAGHLQPLLRRPDGATEEVAAEGGPPLGVLPEAEFPITAVGLAAGTVLALMPGGVQGSGPGPGCRTDA